MQRGGIVSPNGQAACSFCQHEGLIQYTLKETVNFFLITDHAPLIEGHLLIIPRGHYTCYGDLPAELDSELYEIKDEVRAFFAQYYAPPVFWEHGVFRQTVFHAHLHCFPFGETRYDLTLGLHKQLINSQDELRAWHAKYGHYFYLEDSAHTIVFPPDVGYYQRIIQEVLWPSAAPRLGEAGWRSPQQRYEARTPLIQAARARWQRFEQQRAEYAR